MVKFISATATLFLLIHATAFCQPQSREELEKQRQQLKKELEQTEKMLNENKAKTKENTTQWLLIKKKVDIQDRVIDNINRDINLLDNNMYTTQKDINRYDRILDTLKQEYAKSMVYAYKNRGNYDFLNFIFSAASFNDAIKRVAYLKSYRNYREMQGENILRTQELRKRRIEELSGTKQQKNVVLQTKDKEMSILEGQKQEQDKILAALKNKGKELNNQAAAKRKQINKLNSIITAAMKRALAEAKAAEEKRAADEKKANALAIKNNKAENTNTDATVKTNTKKTTTAPAKAPVRSILLNDENIRLNEKFEQNRGILPWPVDNGNVLMHFSLNTLGSGTGQVDNPGLTIATEIGSPVKAVFNGTVSTVTEDESTTIIIQHGKYFTMYSNLSGVSVKKGQVVTGGQVIGRAMPNLDGIGTVEFIMFNEKGNFDPAKWLKPHN